MQYFDSGNIQGYYADTADGFRHIHFYGSNEDVDWFRNLQFWKQGWTDCHAGFRASAEHAMVFLEVILDFDNLIILTGHSYGAAIAVGLADLLRRRKRQVLVQTAGCPRYGGIVWWLLHGRKLDHTRYEVIGDPVPYLPFFLLNFRHSGKRILIDNKDVVPTPKDPFAKHMPAAYRPYLWFQL